MILFSRVSQWIGMVWIAMAVTGCQGSVDPAALSIGPNGEVDPTVINGLYIWGSLAIDGDPRDVEPGRLDLVTLQNALLADCYDELVVEDQNGPVHYVCGDGELSKYRDFQDESSCRANVCAAQLNICLGLRNQELAEAVGPVELSTWVFDVDENVSFIEPDGSYRIRLSHDGGAYARELDASDSHELDYHYLIPPQLPANRTLLLRAATFAFREAGIRGMLATDEETCTWALAAGAYYGETVEYNPASERTEGGPVSVADLLVVGLVESLERLAEASAAAMENERSVAEAVPGEIGDPAELYTRRWQAPLNSEASAIALLASRNLEAARAVTLPVTRDASLDSVQRAIELLRAAAIDIDESRSIDEVASDVVLVLDRSIDPGSPESELHDAATRMLTAAGTNWVDLGEARQILLEERDALLREVTLVEGTEPGRPQRFHGMQEPNQQLGRDTLYSLVASAGHNLLGAISAFDDTSFWARSSTKTVSIEDDVGAGPSWGPDSDASTADRIYFRKIPGYARELSQKALVPEGTDALSFSVYLKATDPAATKLSLSIETDGSQSATQTIELDEDLSWRRFAVSLPLEEAAAEATVTLSAPGKIRFFAWGAQLEQGGLGALSPGFEEPVDVRSRQYAESGVAQGLDAIRQAAVDLYSRMEGAASPCASAADCDEYQDLLRAGIREGEVFAGRYRYHASLDDTTGETLIRLFGVAPDQDMVLVSGLDGLRCMTRRSIDGAPCADQLSDFILASTGNGDFDMTNTLSGPDSINGYAQLSTLLVPGDWVFVVSDGEVIGGHNVPLVPKASGTAYRTEATYSSASPYAKAPFAPRQRTDSVEPEDFVCDVLAPLGAPRSRNYVPPLENEITEDDNQYESSWRHYLDLARSTADEADRLGEELFEAGLQMDLRSEEARSEIEQLCGASVDLVDGDFEDVCSGDAPCESRLATCLRTAEPGSPNYLIPYVALSGDLCIFVDRVRGFCRCDPSVDGCEAAMLNCPFPMSDDDTCSPSDNPFQGLAGTYDVFHVTNSLDLFGSEQHPQDEGYVDCQQVHRLRDRAYSARSDSERERILLELQDIDWITPRVFAAAAKQLRLEREYPNFYVLTMGGRVVADADARVAPGNAGEAYENCPLVYPWRSQGEIVRDRACLGDQFDGRCGTSVMNERIRCASVEGCDSDDFACLYDEAFNDEGVERIEWGQHIAQALTALESIGGIRGAQNEVVASICSLDSCDSGISPCENCGLSSFSYRFRPSLHFPWESLSGLPLLEVGDADDGETGAWFPRYAVAVNCCDSRWSPGESSVCPDPEPYCEPAWLCEDDDVSCYVGRGDYAQQVTQFLPDAGCAPSCDAEPYYSDAYRLSFRNNFYSCLVEGGACDFEPETRYAWYYDINTLRGHFWRVEGCTYDGECGDEDRSVDVDQNNLWNAVEMTCWVLESMGAGACDEAAFDVETYAASMDVPATLECMANLINRDLRSSLLANIPSSIVDDLRRQGEEARYPTYGGEMLNAVLDIDRGFTMIVDGTAEISRAIRGAGMDMRSFRATVELSRLQNRMRLAELEREVALAVNNVVRTVGQVIQGADTSGLGDLIIGAFKTAAASTLLIGAAVSDLAVTQNFQEQMTEYAQEQQEWETEDALSRLGASINERMGALNTASSSILEGYRLMQSGLGRMEAIQNRVEQLLAQASFRDADGLGRVWRSNTRMRQRENTLRARYYRALSDARGASWLARRAIEFRLGVDLDDMGEDLTLVEAPRTWAGDICNLYGFDYAADDLQGYIGGDDEYSQQYVTEYVNRLENLVESYPIDFPFSDSTDVNAMSLRELVASQPLACWSEGPNLLYYSDDLNRIHVESHEDGMSIVRGWFIGGCQTNEEDTEITDRCLIITEDDPESAYCGDMFCFGEDPEAIAEGEEPHGAERISDASWIGRPEWAANTGYISQVVQDVVPGLYVLGFWVRYAGDNPFGISAEYRIEVLDRPEGENEWTVVAQLDSRPPVSWRHATLYFQIEPFNGADTPHEVEIRMYPSVDNGPTDAGLSDNSPFQLPGDLWLWGADLREVPEYRCGNPDECAFGNEYLRFRTTETRGHWVDCDVGMLADFDFQDRFTRQCTTSRGRRCEPSMSGDCECYRELTFSLSLDEIERGDLFRIEPVATRNYNYRQGRVALNIQGTNVVSCGSESPPSCSSSGVVPYTLEHDGTDMPVRNWDWQTVEFTLSTGRIEHGRALAAEVVPTNPMSSTQRTLFEDYWKSELRGRPLQGLYTLRIWEIPGLQWANVEDVQLILDYRYWTRFGD